MTAVALVENLQRENLNPIEEAIAYRRLIDEFGFTQEEVSEKVGRSRPFIANTVRLLNLPTQVQEHVSRGTMTPGQARPLLVLPTATLQIEAANEILSQSLTARGAEELAKKWNTRKNAQAKKRTISVASNTGRQNIVEELSRHLGTRVEIEDRSDGGGMIKIEFYSTEEFQRLIEIFTGVGVVVSDGQKRNKANRFSV
jgi:ParB family chromosome partitioning protein